MFGNTKENHTKTVTSTPVSGSLNSLVTGTRIEGDVKSESDIRVDGIIHGSLDCKAKVIIGPTGQIFGKITCQNAVIEGTLEGEIQVDEILKLEKSAVVKAEIVTSKIVIAAGAKFNGNCKMGTADKIKGIGSGKSNKSNSRVDNNAKKHAVR